MISKIKETFFSALVDTDEDEALSIIRRALKEKEAPEELIFQVILPSIEKMIYEYITTQNVSLSQHFLAARIAETAADVLLPHLPRKGKKKSAIVLGTSFADFHGLGKKIVKGILKANMYTVIDLGINITPENFVDAAVKEGAAIIGISSMMIHTALGEKGARGVRKILHERDLENKIKIIVGGAPYKFDENLYKEAHADGWAPDALACVPLIESLLKELSD